MLNSKSFLAVDFGASNLKLAEFELTETGGLLLRQYRMRSLGQEGAQEATREAAMMEGLQGVLSETAFGSKMINLCAPGFHTFSKFVKLPPVDTSKVTQIIQYEAQQNVPFPLEEVVWDYQILGATPTGELEVMLVAIKSDIVEGLFRVAETAGLRLQLVDVSPASLCNAFRYNYGDLEGCTMLLDIGAKTSNLLFFEKGSVYSRGINIGANSITQDFSKESKLAFDEAERLKIEEGFVSLGGAYEEPDNEHQAAISKIARQVMTRLHIQVNQTVQFYRGQQGGAAPERLFLSGGAAIMPYTAQFFSEKLNVSVEYFNPFRNVEIDPELDLEELATVAHSMGEVVGLGLRNLAHCPVELNLMPKSSLSRQQLKEKQPYLAATALCLLLILLSFGFFHGKLANDKQKHLDALQEDLRPLMAADGQLKTVNNQLKRSLGSMNQLTTWMEDRFHWATVLDGLRGVLIKVETQSKSDVGADVGVWIEKFEPTFPPGHALAGAGTGQPQPVRKPPARAARPARNNSNPVNRSNAGASSVEGIDTLLLTFRGINMDSTDPAANNQIAFSVAKSIKEKGDIFLAEGTELVGNLKKAEDGLTFEFQVEAKLKRKIGL